MADVQRHSIASRALRSIGYDEATGELELEFAGGRVYRYESVPPSVVRWLRRAPNKGRYVAAHLSGRYQEARVGIQATPDDQLVQCLEDSLQRGRRG